ncbi:MAG: peptidoglycan editing factor PgeF [Rhodospirillales bacterium]|nr:peptidoglycan editing factor PgeF [Rhodospirillales bacterium]
MTQPPLPHPLRAAALAVPHGFFTREGGVSTGPFASLNCSLSSQDRRENVLENRARVARCLGGAPDALLGLHQVHGIAVARVRQGWATGEGPQADAMVTAQPGFVLGIVTADCAPVLFADAAAGIVGAAHAGWRGAVAGVLEATIAAMCDLGATRTRIAAAVGPCIAQPSYEVGADLRDAVLAHDAGDDRFFASGQRAGHWQFDLPGYCAARLRGAAIAQVEVLGADTLAEEARFFSHRRRTLAGGGPIGHQMSAIAVAA